MSGYPRYFDVPAMGNTYTANTQEEAEQAIQMGAVEIPALVHQVLSHAYNAGHKNHAAGAAA